MSFQVPEQKIIIKYQQKLLFWYRKNKRIFTWRIQNDPYKIIIAEIMLQKTNAEKVEKVYSHFLEKYPDFKSLMNANESELKNLIKYLGLQNQKAPILMNLAKKIIYDFDNQLPSNKNDLCQIKGLGEYIANAVLCFAFNRRVPIIDGNIIRILERIFNIKSEKKDPRTDKFIWELMERLIPLKDYKDFNYALLDFAAKICTFYKPKCYECFFKRDCHFNQLKTF